jgi:hypothetical protein
MHSDREMAARADPQLAQYFLVSAEKLSKLIAAAGIRPQTTFWKSEPESAPSPEHFRDPEASRLSNLTNGS